MNTANDRSPENITIHKQVKNAGFIMRMLL